MTARAFTSRTETYRRKSALMIQPLIEKLAPHGTAAGSA
jgi:hypothetical protein